MSDKPDKPKVSRGDPGECPGPEFVLVRWVKPFVDEAVGAVEWCERRRAANLQQAGHVEDVKPDNEPKAEPKT